jgi:hypothetical protein
MGDSYIGTSGMNLLSQERQIQILNALVEGVSIRSTERMT